MLDTLKIFEKLKETFDPSAAKNLAEILGTIYEELKNTVTKEDFRELNKIVFELGEAQKRTEQRVEELAEAQKRTEQRIEELAEAQKRTEQRIEELAEAQKRTEQRVEELAEAQKVTEVRLTRLEETVQELIKAQKETEQEIRELTKSLKELVGEHKKTRDQLGGLSHTVGYVLEDRAYKGLPRLLKRDFSVDVINLKRDYIEIAPNRYEEVNIIGKAKSDGRELWIIGECKTQLKKSDIDDFINLVKKVDKVIKGEKILVAVTYQASPAVRRYAESKDIKLYFSYEMPL